MKTLILTAGVLSALLVGPQLLVATSQDAGMPEMPEMPTPTAMPQHEMLAECVGEWDAALVFDGPMGETTMTGTESVTMFGPFYQVADFSSEFMGQPFQGRATVGYDPIRDEWVSTWMDTIMPSLQVMRGDYDEATKSVTFYYDGVNELSQLQPAKAVMTFTGGDTRTYTAYWLDAEGNATRNMHIDYTRANAAAGRMR